MTITSWKQSTKTELFTNLAKTIKHIHFLLKFNQYKQPKLNFYATQVQIGYRIDQLPLIQLPHLLKMLTFRLAPADKSMCIDFLQLILF